MCVYMKDTSSNKYSLLSYVKSLFHADITYLLLLATFLLPTKHSTALKLFVFHSLFFYFFIREIILPCMLLQWVDLNWNKEKISLDRIFMHCCKIIVRSIYEDMWRKRERRKLPFVPHSLSSYRQSIHSYEDNSHSHSMFVLKIVHNKMCCEGLFVSFISKIIFN